MGESAQPLHPVHRAGRLGQGIVAGIGLKADAGRGAGAGGVEQRVIAFLVSVPGDRDHAPQHRVEGGRRHQQALCRDAIGRQTVAGNTRDHLLRRHAPSQVGRAEHQARGVGFQAKPGAARGQRPHTAHQQGHGVERVDDEHTAHAIRCVGERQA